MDDAAPRAPQCYKCLNLGPTIYVPPHLHQRTTITDLHAGKGVDICRSCLADHIADVREDAFEFGNLISDFDEELAHDEEKDEEWRAPKRGGKRKRKARKAAVA